jgi:hypothetical protein
MFGQERGGGAWHVNNAGWISATLAHIAHQHPYTPDLQDGRQFDSLTNGGGSLRLVKRPGGPTLRLLAVIEKKGVGIELLNASERVEDPFGYAAGS